MSWAVCFWGGIEWFSIAKYPDYEKARQLANDCQRRSGRRLYWKVLLEVSSEETLDIHYGM